MEKNPVAEVVGGIFCMGFYKGMPVIIRIANSHIAFISNDHYQKNRGC